MIQNIWQDSDHPLPPSSFHWTSKRYRNMKPDALQLDQLLLPLFFISLSPFSNIADGTQAPPDRDFVFLNSLVTGESSPCHGAMIFTALRGNVFVKTESTYNQTNLLPEYSSETDVHSAETFNRSFVFEGSRTKSAIQNARGKVVSRHWHYRDVA